MISTPNATRGQGTRTRGARGPSATLGPNVKGPGDASGPAVKAEVEKFKVPAGQRPTAQLLEHYDAIYKETKRDKPGQLLATVSGLGQVGKTPDIEAALAGYLKYHADKAEPWMYEMLAVMRAYNKAKPAEVRAALDRAAALTQKSKDPNGLTSVAALMIQYGDFAKATPLIDAAIKKMPYALRPLDLSVEIARREEDPKRMVAALDRMLSLGWPGVDDVVHDYAQKRLNELAEVLDENKRTAEATDLRERWRDLSGRDVYVRLRWDPRANADLDMVVEESIVPGVVGARASREAPATVYGGALVKDGRGRNAEEIYVCPRAMKPRCTFTVRVDRAFADPDNPLATATLEIVTREGMDGEHKETRTIRFDSLGRSAPIAFRFDQGRRDRTLPYIVAVPIVKEDPKAKAKGKGKAKGQPDPKAPAARPGTGTNPKAARPPAASRPSIVP